MELRRSANKGERDTRMTYFSLEDTKQKKIQYYEVFATELGSVSGKKDRFIFTGKDIGTIEINTDIQLDIYINDEWTTLRYDGNCFINSHNTVIDITKKDKVRYRKSIDMYMKRRVDELLHPDSFQLLISKLCSFNRLSLFDCVLFRESGELYRKGSQFFLFENMHTLCSVHHSYIREPYKNHDDKFCYIYDRFDFMTMDGHHFTEVFEKKYDEIVEEPSNYDEFENEHLEYLKKKGLID